MNDFKKSLLIGISILFCHSPLQAQQDADIQRENPSTEVPYESGRVGEPTCEDRWSNFLPILGKDACELGYVLPRPFGITVGFMHQVQPFDVGGILVNGIDVKTPGLAVVNEVKNSGDVYNLRADVWILPFWNIYGLVGKTKGQASGPITIDLNPVFPTICKLPGRNCDVDTIFNLNYDADVRGIGTTLAGGYKNFFGMIDFNWSKADLNISATDAKAKVISSRIGYNGKIGWFSGVFWVGVMYQDINQSLDLPIDIGDQSLLVTVSIEQANQQQYNFVTGGQWDISRSFSLLAEFGFGKRKSQMLNLTYRF